MNRPAVLIPVIILVNACVWALTLIMSSKALSGTDAYQQIQNILAGGTIASIMVVGGGLSGLAKMMKSRD